MTEPLASPYTPGIITTFMPGRDRQNTTLERVLVNVAGRAHFAGRIHVLQGARGVGKTSLLRSAERTARSFGLSTVFVTATADGVLAPLAAGLRDRMQHLSPQPLSRQFRTAVSKVGVKLGPAELALDLTHSSAGGDAIAAFKHVVAAVARCRDANNRGVVLLVDEFQDAPATDIRTIATAWQELQAETLRPGAGPLPAAAIAAGLGNTQERITDGASFGERFRFDTLANLPEDAATQALVQPALRLGVTWDDDALQAALAAASGYPYFIQLYAHEIWETRDRHPHDRLTLADADGGLAAAADQIETFFRGRWNRATPAERRLLQAIAESGQDQLTRGEIAKRMGVTTTDLSVARAALLGKGLLAVPRRGVLAFTAPGFGRFILEELLG